MSPLENEDEDQKYYDAFDQDTESLRLNAYSLNETQPADKTARALDLAQKKGVPRVAIESDLEGYEAEDQSNRLKQLRETAPKTYKWLSQTPDNYAVAKDDVKELGAIEKSIQGPSKSAMDIASNGLKWAWYESIKRGAWVARNPQEAAYEVGDLGRSAASALPQMLGSTAAGAGEIYNADMLLLERALKNVPGIKQAYDFEARLRSERPGTDEFIKKYASPGDALKAVGSGYKDIQHAWEPDKMGFEDQVASAVGQMAAAILARNPSLMAGSYTMMGVDQQAESLRAAGIDPSTRPLELTTGGAITGLSEKMRLDSMMKILPPSMRAKVGSYILARIGGQAAEEGLQEGAENILQNLLTTTYDPNAEILSGVGEAVGVAGTSAAILQGIVELALPGKRRRGSVDQMLNEMNTDGVTPSQKGLGAFFDSVGKMKMKSHSPEKMTEAFSEILKDSGLETTTVDVNALGQALQQGGATEEQIAEVMAAMGVTEDAKNPFGQVQVPTAKLAASQTVLDNRKVIEQHIFAGEDGTTPAQRVQAEGNVVEAMQKQIADAIERGQAVIDFEEQITPIREKIAEDVKSTGVYKGKQLERVTTLVQSMFEHLAVGSGQTNLVEFYNEMFAKMGTRGPLAEGEELDPDVLPSAQASGYQGIDTGEARQWLAAKAKGLDMSVEGVKARAKEMGFDTDTVLYHGTNRDFDAFSAENMGRTDEGGSMYGTGHYFATTPDAAKFYAENTVEKFGGAVNTVPAYVRLKNPLTADMLNRASVFADFKAAGYSMDRFPNGYMLKSQSADFAKASAQFTEIAQKLGYDGVVTRDQVNVFDPSNIRSVNAAFDPDEAGSSDLLAQAEKAGYQGTDKGEAKQWLAALSKFGPEGMTTEAIKARAREQGFDTETVYYRGMTRPVEGGSFTVNQGDWGPGVYVGNAGTASSYSNSITEGAAPTVYPLYIRGKMMDVADYQDLQDAVRKSMTPAQRKAEGAKNAIDLEAQRRAKEAGFVGVEQFRAVYDGKSTTGSALVFDPSNIRSVNATFDPDQSDSADLLAQLIGPKAKGADKAILKTAQKMAKSGIEVSAKDNLINKKAELNRATREHAYAESKAQTKQDKAEVARLKREMDRAQKEVDKAEKSTKTVRRPATRQEIWDETAKLGQPWYQDDNGDWISEIEDGAIVVREIKGKMSEVVEMPSIYAQYPELAKQTADARDKVKVREEGGKDAPGTLGAYTKYPFLMGVNLRISDRSKEGQPYTATHEIQHAVDEIEDREMGRRKPYYSRDTEVRAFNTMYRMLWSMEERIATPPWKTEDMAVRWWSGLRDSSAEPAKFVKPGTLDPGPTVQPPENLDPKNVPDQNVPDGARERNLAMPDERIEMGGRVWVSNIYGKQGSESNRGRAGINPAAIMGRTFLSIRDLMRSAAKNERIAEVLDGYTLPRTKAEENKEAKRLEGALADKLLDMDAQLSEQPAAVRAVLEAMIAHEQTRPDLVRSEYTQTEPGYFDGMTANQILEELAQSMMDEDGSSYWPGDTIQTGMQAVIQQLRAAGVVGGKYFPGGVNTAEDAPPQTQSIVIFDERAPVLLTDRSDNLMQNQQGDRRGQYNTETRQLDMFEAADITTMMHEMAHWYLDFMEKQVAAGSANPFIVAQLAQVDSWYQGHRTSPAMQRKRAEYNVRQDFGRFVLYRGAERIEGFATPEEAEAKIDWIERQEAFAETFEVYLQTGKSPSEKMRSVFADFAKWISSLWKKMYPAGSPDRANLNPEIVGVMDRMLASEEEIDAMREHLDATTGTLARKLLEDGHLTQKQYDKAVATLEKALEAVKEEVRTRVIKAQMREREEWWQTERRAKEIQAIRTLERTPAARAASWLSGQGYKGDVAPDTSVDRDGDVLPQSIRTAARMPMAEVDAWVRANITADESTFPNGDTLTVVKFPLTEASDAPEVMLSIRMKADGNQSGRADVNLFLDNQMADAMESVEDVAQRGRMAHEMFGKAVLVMRKYAVEYDPRAFSFVAAESQAEGTKAKSREDLYRYMLSSMKMDGYTAYEVESQTSVVNTDADGAKTANPMFPSAGFMLVKDGENVEDFARNEILRGNQRGGGAGEVVTALKATRLTPDFDASGRRVDRRGSRTGAADPGGALGQEVVRPDNYKPVEETASADNSFEFARNQLFATNRDLKVGMQDRVQRAADENGADLLDDDYLVRMTERDARSALLGNANAVGWYDEKVRKAIAALTLLHPELETDADARFAFTWALAVTSNGLKVDKNFELAETVYSAWKASSKEGAKRVMPTNVGIGTAAGAINKSLGLYNRLVKKHGVQKVLDFMTARQAVKEVQGFTGEKVSGENLTTEVFGAAALGPKIGNGFFMNLYGEFGQLTMDRWLMRTWGRWSATLITDYSSQARESRKKLGALLKLLSNEDKRALEKIIRRPIKLREIDEVGLALQRASQKPALREEMNKLGLFNEATEAAVNDILGPPTKGADRNAVGAEIRKRGNALAKYLDGQKEQPSGPPERNKIRAVFARALENMKADYPALTMADLQALLWYPEKRLYDTAKAKEGEENEGYEDDEAPDYANAARNLVVSKGVAEAAIRDAYARIDVDVQAARRAGRVERDGAGASGGSEAQGNAQGAGQESQGGTLGQPRGPRDPRGWGQVAPPPEWTPMRLDLEAIKTLHPDFDIKSLPKAVLDHSRNKSAVDEAFNIALATAATLKTSVEEGGPDYEANRQFAEEQQAYFEGMGIDINAPKQKLRAAIAAAFADASVDLVTPDQAAEQLGFNSGDELLNALANMSKRSEIIKQMTDMAMAEAHGDPFKDGTFEEEARQAAEKEVKFQAAEIEFEAITRALGVSANKRAIKEAAERAVSIMSVKELSRWERHLDHERRETRNAMAAVNKGDMEAAMKHKRMQMTHMYMARAMREKMEAAEKLRVHLLTYEKSEHKRKQLAKAGDDYLDQMDALLHRYHLRKDGAAKIRRAAEKAPLEALHVWALAEVAAMDPLQEREELVTKEDGAATEGADPMAGLETVGISKQLETEAYLAKVRELETLAEEASRVSYETLTVEEFEQVGEQADMIYNLARAKTHLLASHRNMLLETAVAEIEESILDNKKKDAKQEQLETDLPMEKIRRGIQSYFEAHRTLLSYFRQMDGGKDGGPMQMLLSAAMSKAFGDRAAVWREMEEGLADLFSVYEGADRKGLFGKKVFVPGPNIKMTKQGILAVALNMGTEKNRKRMMDSEGWSEADLFKIVDSLDQRDWQFVQNAWKFLGGYFPQAQAVHTRVHGIPMEQVEPIEVATKFGVIPGGYYPIVFDKVRSSKADQRALTKDAKAATAGLGASSRKGYTKARSSGKITTPIRYSVLDVMVGHLTEVADDITLKEPLIDVGRIIIHPDIEAAIRLKYGAVVYKEIVDSLKEVKNGQQVATKAAEKVLVHLRHGATTVGLGWRFSTALLQAAGLTNSMARVGTYWVARGIIRSGVSAFSRENAAKFAIERSSMMANRARSQQREISDLRNNFSGTITPGWLKESFFWMITATQMHAVDVPTWIGQYEKSISKGATEVEAALQADLAVQEAQGTGEAYGLADIQRGSPLMKLFTNFMSYMITTMNLAVQKTSNTNFKSPGEIAHLALDMMALIIWPVVSKMIFDAVLKGVVPDDDDDETWATLYAKNQLSFLMSMNFIPGQLAGAVTGYGYDGPVGTAALKNMTDAIDGKGDWKRPALASVGAIFHWPTGQLDTTMRGWQGIADGHSDDYTDVIFGPDQETREEMQKDAAREKRRQERMN